MSKRILIVEDQEDLRGVLRDLSYAALAMRSSRLQTDKTG
jgi:hypothetical protein